MKFYLKVIGYSCLFVLIRVTISDSFGLDDAEQILLSQGLYPTGYSQPPLFTWIVKAVFLLLGHWCWTFAFVKAIMMATILIALFKVSNEFFDDSRKSEIVATSYFLLSADMAVISSTHTLLVFMLCVLTLFVYLKILRFYHSCWYLIFGLLIGAGVLAKYNYIVFIVPLLLASFYTLRSRKAILNGKTLFSLMILLLILLLYVRFGMDFEKTRDFCVFGNYLLYQFSPLSDWPKQLVSITMSLVSLLCPLVLVYLIFCPRMFVDFLPCKKNKTLPWSGGESLDVIIILKHFFLFGFVVVTVATFVGLDHYRQRWFIPVFFVMPLFLFLRQCSGGSNVVLRRLQVLQWVVGWGSLILFCVKIVFGSYVGQYDRLNFPFQELAEKLKSSVARNQLILSDRYFIAGNLKLCLDAAWAFAPKFDIFEQGLESGKIRLSAYDQLLIAWDGERKMPLVLSDLVEKISGKLLYQEGPPSSVEAFYKYSHEKKYKLNFIILDLKR